MQFGSSLPITAFPDVGAVKAYAEALDAAGFDFTSTAGHVMAQPPVPIRSGPIGNTSGHSTIRS